MTEESVDDYIKRSIEEYHKDPKKYERARDDSVKIECRVIHETEKAILIVCDLGKSWFPKSYVKFNNSKNTQTISVSSWLMEKKVSEWEKPGTGWRQQSPVTKQSKRKKHKKRYTHSPSYGDNKISGALFDRCSSRASTTPQFKKIK